MMWWRDNFPVTGTRGNTRRSIRVEVGWVKWSAEDKYVNLSGKWNQGENIIGTVFAKDQFRDTRWTCTKEVILFTSSFHDKFYIGSMGMNVKVQGRLPLIQCLTFHSLLVFEEMVVRKIYLVKHQKSMTRITFEFTHIGGKHMFDPSGQLRNIYHKLAGVMNSSSEAEHGWQSQGIQCIEGNMYQRKSAQDLLNIKDFVGY